MITSLETAEISFLLYVVEQEHPWIFFFQNFNFMGILYIMYATFAKFYNVKKNWFFIFYWSNIYLLQKWTANAQKQQD